MYLNLQPSLASRVGYMLLLRKTSNLFKTFSMVIILSHVVKLLISIRHHCSQNGKHITETNPENSLNYPITITFFSSKMLTCSE